MKPFATVMTLLRERQQFLEDIGQGNRLQVKLFGLLISSAVFFAIYGLIIDWFFVICCLCRLPNFCTDVIY